MNRLLQDEDETRDYDRLDTRRGQGGGQDREISLGTTMLLGIFFAIALLCAVFFGFGYSLGSRHAAPAAAAAPPPEAASSAFSGFKPSPFGQGPAKSSSSAQGETTPPPTVTVKTPPPAKTVVEDTDAEPAPKPAPIVRQAAPAAAAPVPMPPVVAASPTTSVVQVAAVSHQEDADLLVSTLKRRGYAVSIRQEPQDHLLHVQIGPFATRKDAEAMRQRLLNDGFNAIVK